MLDILPHASILHLWRQPNRKSRALAMLPGQD
jgi:hypothetical protein